jgi:hypothetical protein
MRSCYLCAVVTSFHYTWCEHYAPGGHPNLILFNSLESVTMLWQGPEMKYSKCALKNMPSFFVLRSNTFIQIFGLILITTGPLKLGICSSV